MTYDEAIAIIEAMPQKQTCDKMAAVLCQRVDQFREGQISSDSLLSITLLDILCVETAVRAVQDKSSELFDQI